MSNLSNRARMVSNIFDILAWFVLIVGGLAAVGTIISIIDDNLFTALFLGVVVAAYTVVSWAGIQLASLVAGYIEQKS